MASTVTAVEAAPSNPKQVLVYVDAEATARLFEWQVPDLGLEAGAAWTAETAERVAAAERFARALEAASAALDRRALSRRELVDKLTAAGHDEQAAAEAADYAERVGLLDEDALGRALIRAEREDRGAAPRRWRDKLARRGLDEARIERLVAEQAPSAAAQRDEAAELLRRWWPQVRELSPAARRRRLGNRLARRGYEADVIAEALAAVDDAEPEAEP